METGATSKRKRHCQLSLRTPEFVGGVHGMVDNKPIKSVRYFAKNVCQKRAIRHVIHYDLVFCKQRLGHVNKPLENSLFRVKRLLYKVKYPDEEH